MPYTHIRLTVAPKPDDEDTETHFKIAAEQMALANSAPDLRDQVERLTTLNSALNEALEDAQNELYDDIRTS